MDKKLFKGINHVLNDLKQKKEESEELKKNKDFPEYFEGQFDAYEDSISLIERILEDYNKRVSKK